MTTPNHIVGGFVITGIFGSFMNINILASPWYIATTIIASVLPDIDHTRSIIGKIFLPFSRFINRRFGHRTITHSLLVLLISSLLMAYLEITFFHSSQFTKVYFLGFSQSLDFGYDDGARRSSLLSLFEKSMCAARQSGDAFSYWQPPHRNDDF